MKSVSLSTTFFLLSFNLFNIPMSLSMSRKAEPDFEMDLELQGGQVEVEPVEGVEREASQVPTLVERKSKLFPYFLIQFPNEHCSTRDGSGVCVSQKECRDAGGTTLGVCAKGFGACCRFTRTCGKEGGDILVRENATEIRTVKGNPACRFILPKGKNMCQVRLDFKEFQYGEGLPTGECTDNKVTIQGGSVGPLSLCGDLKDQHLYLNYGSAERIYISSGEPISENDKFSIVVSYIRCNSKESVPSYCSQMLIGNEGELRSFNWPQQQLNNQEYTVCITPLPSQDNPLSTLGGGGGSKQKTKRSRNDRFLNPTKDRRRIIWTTCGKGPDDFLISGKRTDPPVLNPLDCSTDYVQVFGANRQCGNQFVKEEVSTEPYLINVRFDGSEMTTRVQGMNLFVGKPGEGCESLNTRETICTEVGAEVGKLKEEAKKMCRCMKTVASKMKKREDEGNTGFCLKYKIVD